ncbi:uncharacterized protein F5147DRAFT_589383, partial [Suillus discolor]
ISEAIYITNITIFHVTSTLVASTDMQKAPRKMALWGILDSPEQVKSAARHTHGSTLVCHSSCLVVVVSHSSHFAHPPLFKLANITYDIHSGNAAQSFEVDSDVYTDHNNLSFQKVLLEFQDNWGVDSTCIYNVSIHGIEATN